MKIFSHEQEARNHLKNGITKVAKLVKPTLGNSGKTSVIGRKNLPPIIADDAISIVMNTELENEFENEAVWLLKEALMNTSKKVGDSTATTLTLIESICNAIFDKLNTNSASIIKSNKVNTIKLKKELDTICEEIKERLLKKARKVKTKELYDIALTAGSYEWIAKIVSEVFQKVGAYGYVEIEEGVKTGYEIFNGLEIKAGYHSEYYINNDNKECVLENVYVFVTNQTLNTAFFEKAIPLLKLNGKKNCVVVAPDFDRNALASCVATHIEPNENLQFTVIPLKLPTFDKNDVLIDIATLCNAKFFDKSTFTTFESFINEIDLSSFGFAKKAVITDSTTRFIDGKGDVTERLKQLNAEYSKTLSEFDKDIIEKRIASLSGGSATITIGGFADTELMYYKLKLENAVNSTQNSLKLGVVRGGGLALYQIAEEMPANLITEAIKAPYKTIQDNNGEPFDIPETVNDAVTNTIGALESARSFAGNILLTESIITNKNEPETNKDEN